MKKDEEKRDFTMSFAELEQLVRNVISSMRRDNVEFANYGVDSSDIDAFEDLCNSFENLPTDAELEGIVTIKTQAKDAKAEELQVETREIATRVEVKFGERSGEYRSLDVGDLSRLSDPLLLRCARRVHRRATDMLADLASEGLTQQILDDYNVLIQGLEDALDDKDDAVKDRDVATNDRVKKANELYDFLTKYCNYGKRIWINTNEAKYNDYVIYKTTTELPGKVQNLSFDYLTGAFSWDASPHSETYRLVYREQGSSDSWTKAYVGTDTSVAFAPADGDWEFRCRGINDEGKGPWSDILGVNIGGIPAPSWLTAVYHPAPFPIPTPPPKILPEHVLLEWENVTEATKYEVWRSVVNVGEAAGAFTEIAEVDKVDEEMYHDFEVTLNKRNYYYIVAKNASDRSAPSVGAWAETVE